MKIKPNFLRFILCTMLAVYQTALAAEPQVSESIEGPQEGAQGNQPGNEPDNEPDNEQGGQEVPVMLRTPLSEPQCSSGMCTLFEVYSEDQRTLRANRKAPVYVINDRVGSYIQGFFSGTEAWTCRKSAAVPQPIYESVTKIIESIAKAADNNSLPPALTPAQQTMLLFYTTVMQQTNGFTCANGTNNSSGTSNSSVSSATN